MNALEQLCAWLRSETPPEDTDWDTVIALAMQQKLAAVLYKRVRQVSASLSTAQLALLRETYFNVGARSMQRQYQMVCVLHAFQEAHIPVVALKGAYLGAVVYGDAALRPMQDLDVLVQHDALRGAADVLAALGYRVLGDDLGVREQCFHYQYEHLCHPELPVELHWNLTPPGSLVDIDVAGLFERAQTVTLAGVETLVMCPEDLLVYLCVHTAHIHVFEGGLRAAYDVAQVVARGALDWDVVWDRAAQWHATHAVQLVLYLAREWFASPVAVAMPEAEKLGYVMERLQGYPAPLYKSFVFSRLWLARGWFEMLLVIWGVVRTGSITALLALANDLLRLPYARQELQVIQERNARAIALVEWLAGGDRG